MSGNKDVLASGKKDLLASRMEDIPASGNIFLLLEKMYLRLERKMYITL